MKERGIIQKEKENIDFLPCEMINCLLNWEERVKNIPLQNMERGGRQGTEQAS